LSDSALPIDSIHAELIRCLYSDRVRAQLLATEARQAAEESDDLYTRAVSLRCAGHIHYAAARHEEALRAYREALELLQALGRDAVAARVLFGGVQPLLYLGRYDEALLWAEQARTIFEKYGDEVRLSRLDLNVGNVLYRQDRYPEALERYRKARPVLARSGEPQDLAAALSNMAVCCISLGAFQEALNHYREARDWCARHNLAPLVAAADYNIAYLHYLRGDYRDAMDLYHVSREYCGQVGDAYHAALCDLDESEMLLELNMFGEASRLAQSANEGFARLEMNYERGKATLNQAVASYWRGDLCGALSLFRNARTLFARENNRYWPAVIDLYQAIVFDQAGLKTHAIRHLNRAARKLAKSALTGKMALCNIVRGRLAIAQGQLRKGRIWVNRAAGHLDSPPLRFHFHYLLGCAAEAGGALDAAEEQYRTAIAEMESARRRLWLEDLKISFLRDKTAIFEALVRLRLRDSQPAALREAFGYIQQGKSRSLTERLRCERLAPPPQGGPSSEKINDLRRDLNAYYRQIETASALGQPHVGALRGAILDREQQLLRCLSGTAGQASGEPRFEDAIELLTFDEIQARIPAHATLVEYFRVGDEIQAWVLTRDRLHYVPVAAFSRTRDLLRLLQFQMAKFQLGSQYVTRFATALQDAVESHLRDLYAELVEPIRPLLRGSHVIFAPYGFLHHLPFHALLNCRRRHLIDDYTISYAPSASVFALCGARNPSSMTSALVFGSPNPGAPRIEEEARAVAAILPDAHLFLGDEASLREFRKSVSGCRLLHIAAHGWLRRDNPMFSSIRLGDADLQLFDFQDMSIQADLVTLSGCSTGANVLAGADELLGLTRGVLAAGARNLLASLWDVQDHSTTVFMKSFYKCITEEPDTWHCAGAVRRAMLEVREQFPHPYHWAAFVLQGKCG
jgi:CHAT domain-containing protein/tetratricopeptide (TPR) repeat protein